MTPTCLSHLADLFGTAHRSGLHRGESIRSSFIRLVLRQIPLWGPLPRLNMPSADFPIFLRDLPGFSRLLSTRNRWMYMNAPLSTSGQVTGGLPIVLHPRPRASCLISTATTPFQVDGYSVRSAHAFASSLLKALFRVIPLPLATLRRYLTGIGTCACPPRTFWYTACKRAPDKQPGRARHTTKPCTLAPTATQARLLAQREGRRSAEKRKSAYQIPPK